MNGLRRYMILGLSLGLIVNAMAQSSSSSKPAPLDGPGILFHDDLLENLVGKWKLTRKVGTRVAKNRVDVEWILNHQFLQIHMKDVKRPPNYEALITIGYSNEDKRYVAFWTDTFGGKYSEKGFGTKSGNAFYRM